SALQAGLGRVEVAAATAPDAAAAASSRPLRSFETRETVEALFVVAVDVGPPATQLDGFELAAGDVGVGEQAAVAIFGVGDGVGSQDDDGAFGRKALHRGGRGPGTALGRVAGANILRGIDTDQADVGEIAGGKLDPKGVAVDGVGDAGVGRRCGSRLVG